MAFSWGDDAKSLNNFNKKISLIINVYIVSNSSHYSLYITDNALDIIWKNYILFLFIVSYLFLHVYYRVLKSVYVSDDVMQLTRSGRSHARCLQDL